MKRWVAAGITILLFVLLVFPFRAWANVDVFKNLYDDYVNRYGKSPAIVVIGYSSMFGTCYYFIGQGISWTLYNVSYTEGMHGYINLSNNTYTVRGAGNKSYDYNPSIYCEYDVIGYAFKHNKLSNIDMVCQIWGSEFKIYKNSIGYIGDRLDDIALNKGSVIFTPFDNKEYIFTIGNKYEITVTALIDKDFYDTANYNTDTIYLYDSANWSIKLLDKDRIDLMNGKYFFTAKYEVIPCSYVNTFFFKMTDNLIKNDYLEKRIEVRAVEVAKIKDNGKGVDENTGLEIAKPILGPNYAAGAGGDNNYGGSDSQPNSEQYGDDILGRIKYGFDSIMYYLKMPFKFIADVFKSLVQYLSQVKSNVDSVSSVFTSVIGFIPEEIKVLMFSSLVAGFIIVVYKALRG